jgi:protein phosphatase
MKKTLEFLTRSSALPAEDRTGRVATIYGVSDRGRVRENNEDQFLIADLERSLTIRQCGIPANNARIVRENPPGYFMLVADGMGGHEGGETASAVVMDVMVEYAFSMMPWLGGTSGTERSEQALAEGLKEAVERSHNRMREIAARKGFGARMGSTLTLAYVVWPKIFLVHVGDSRAYLWRRGELVRLTRDHNLADQMVQQGLMTEDEARTSTFSRILTNVVGGGQKEAKAELHATELEPDDVLLLCTDGLHGELDEATIESSLACVMGPEYVEKVAKSLVEAAKRAGGKDNITAVVARF